MHRIADGAQSASWCSNGKRSVKSLLTQEQIIPCLGNSCAQDIMFMSGMHPRENLVELGSKELDLHYDFIHTWRLSTKTVISFS
jgi:formamidopyrimidine-DNA glycosylase